MPRPSRRPPLLALAIAPAMLIGLVGCASRVDRRVEPRLAVGGQGAPAALVFADPSRAAPMSSAAELARNDAAISARPPRARLASDDWPEDDRPSLLHARRIRFEERAGTFIYFERPSDVDLHPGHGFDHHHRVHPWRPLPGDLPPWW